jgi:hypothetical protein
MKKMIRKLRSLLVDTNGNGEIVAVLVAVGIAVTLGFLAVQKIGNGASDKADKQATAIKALPGG